MSDSGVQRVSFGPLVFDATPDPGGYVYRFDFDRDETIARLTATYAEFDRLMQRIADVMRPALEELNKAALAIGSPIGHRPVIARVGKRRMRFELRRNRWQVRSL